MILFDKHPTWYICYGKVEFDFVYLKKNMNSNVKSKSSQALNLF